MPEFYKGDGYWGQCPSCGADGLWMHDPDDRSIIVCECGHEQGGV